MSAKGAGKCLVKGCREKGLTPINKADRLEAALCCDHFVEYEGKVGPAKLKVERAMKIDSYRYYMPRMLSVPKKKRDTIWKHDLETLKDEKAGRKMKACPSFYGKLVIWAHTQVLWVRLNLNL